LYERYRIRELGIGILRLDTDLFLGHDNELSHEFLKRFAPLVDDGAIELIIVVGEVKLHLLLRLLFC